MSATPTPLVLGLMLGAVLVGVGGGPQAHAQDAPFVTVWQTDNEGVSDDDQIQIPGTGTDYTVEWEEVDTPSNRGRDTGSGTHTVTVPEA